MAGELKASSPAKTLRLAPVSPDAAPVLARAVLGELGVSGTTNYAGQLYAEVNPALINDAGYGRPGTRVWGEWERIIRTDCAIETALSMITAPLRDASLTVKPAAIPALDPKLAADQAEYVRQNLEDQLEPTWAEFISSLARGTIGIGFSLWEKCWAPAENQLLPNGAGFKLSVLAQRLASSLEYNAWIEQNGKLVEIRQRGLKDGRFVGNLALPADKCLLVSWNREGNNYAGFSAFRPVWYLCKLREHLLKVIGIGHQREALGIPMASMDKDTKLTNAQRRSLQRFLENLIYHENAAIVLPPGVTLNWFNSPGANKGNVLDTWKQLGIAILEVVSAQQAALGTGDTGSRAVGEVHDSTRGTFVNGLKGTLEAALNGVGERGYTGVSRDIVRLNWGAQKAYPKLQLLLPTGSIPAAELVASIVAGIGGGLVTPTIEDENHIRGVLGLKALTPEVRAQALAEKKPPAPLPPTAGVSPGAKDDTPPQGVSSLPKPSVGVQAALAEGARVTLARAGPFVPRRALLAHEEGLDWAGMDDVLSGSREAFEVAARPVLVEELVRAMPAVREAMADGDPSEVAGLELPFARMGELVDALIGRLRIEGRRHVELEARSPKKTQALEEKRAEGEAGLPAVAQGAPVPSVSQGAPVAPLSLGRLDFAKRPRRSRAQREAEVEQLMRAQRELLLRRMRARTIESLQRAAIDAVRTGGDPQSIVADVIQGMLETKALRQDAGLVTTQAFNLGREEAASRLGAVKVVRLSAVLDDVTCGYCERMDGAEFEFQSAAHDEHVPPLTRCEGRDNCRCVLIYEFEEDGFKVETVYPENNESGGTGEGES